MAIIRVIAFFIVFSTISCSILDDDMLSLQQEEYKGNEIRLDGYWWMKLDNFEEDPRMFVYFLYQNGVVLSGLSFPISKQKEKEASFSTKMFRDLTLRSKTGWGVFNMKTKKLL